MSNNDRIVDDEAFRYSEGVVICNEGDTVDGRYGMNAVELTLEDIDALKNGKILYWDDGEYATIVRLAKEE